LEILEKLPDFSHKQEYQNLLVKNRQQYLKIFPDL